MSDIGPLLEKAVEHEPSDSMLIEPIVAAGRRARRRRRVGAGAGALAVTAGVLAVVVSLGSTPQAATPTADRDHSAATPMSLVDLHRAAARHATSSTGLHRAKSYAVHGITTTSLPDLIARAAHVTLSNVRVEVLTPLGDINLSAGVASAQGQYLNVQVVPAGSMSTTPPACSQLQGRGTDGDGYTGACSVVRTSGGYLVRRTARMPDGRHAKTQADLVGTDGSAVLAEADNQAAPSYIRSGAVRPSSDKARWRVVIPPVVSHDPPLTSAQLAALVRSLRSAR